MSKQNEKKEKSAETKKKIECPRKKKIIMKKAEKRNKFHV